MKLDLGCSSKKLAGYLGMDIRPQPGVDYFHDIEETPWPMDSGICEAIHASHVLEHLKPWKFFDVMNEAWRVCQVGAEMTILTPFGLAYAFDPTHCILFQESSFIYLDPSVNLWDIYKPKPWEVVSCTRDESTLELKTILRKKAA